MLYAGRKAAEKNVDTLVQYFSLYKDRNANDLKLVLVGPAEIPLPATAKDHIIDLGFVPLEDKNDAYSAATVFCQPSVNESFSIVMMEAWLSGTPCLAHGQCAVTREHTMGSGGGLLFENYSDFEGCLNHFLENDALRARMAQSGRDYVLAHFTWDHIIERWKTDVFG